VVFTKAVDTVNAGEPFTATATLSDTSFLMFHERGKLIRIEPIVFLDSVKQNVVRGVVDIVIPTTEPRASEVEKRHFGCSFTIPTSFQDEEVTVTRFHSYWVRRRPHSQ
jgi:hypothetical protein